MRILLILLTVLLICNMLVATQMNVFCEMFATPGSAQQDEMHKAVGALRELISANENIVPIIWKSDYSPGYFDRRSLYGIASDPYAVFGGANHMPGTQDDQYSWYYENYNQILSIDSPAELSISSAIEGNNLIVTASLEIEENLPHQENIIGIILTKYRSSQYYIIVEEYAEHYLIQSSAGEYGSYTHYFPMEPAWDLEGMHMMAFMQSSINERQVYQSVMEPLTPNATVQGTVYSQLTMEPLEGAVIKAGKYSTISDESGAYTLPVLHGNYDVDSKITGYNRSIEESVQLNNSDIYDCDFYLNSSLLPVANLEADVHPGDILLEWDPPSLFSPIIEDFESGTQPLGWQSSSNGIGWQFTDDGSSTYWLIPDHTFYAIANDDQGGSNNDGSVDYLDTPPINLANVSFAELSFDYFFEGSYSHIARVLVSSNGGQSWYILGNLKNYPYWAEKAFDLTPYCSSSEVIFRFHSNDNNGAWGSGWAMDNMHIEQDSGLELLGYNIYAAELEGPVNGTTPVVNNTYNPSSLTTGQYHVYVKAVYNYGESAPSNEILINVTGVNTVFSPGKDNQGLLLSAFPNPFNPKTNINFNLDNESKVRLTIFNTKGQCVRNLESDRFLSEGLHSVTWDGTNNSGKMVNSGIYFCKIETQAECKSIKLMLMK